MIKKLKRIKPFLIPLILIFTSLVAILSLFGPILKKEIEYQTQKPQTLVSVTKSYKGRNVLIIPKIGLEKDIVINIDPTNESEYKSALTKGIAHAKGTDLPNTNGSMFLFSHSSVSVFDQSSADFYLLDKLNQKDIITIHFEDNLYKYEVLEKKVINKEDIEYLKSNNKNELILMTCWPLGTDLKRLVIISQKLD